MRDLNTVHNRIPYEDHKINKKALLDLDSLMPRERRGWRSNSSKASIEKMSSVLFATNLLSYECKLRLFRKVGFDNRKERCCDR